MTFACCTLVKLFCKNQFDFFALVKSPLFFLQMITLETSALFFPQMLIPGGSIFATGEAQGVPTGSILLYHTMVRGTLGMFTKQSFLTHCGCQCWWPTSCFLSHSFSCRPPAQSYHGRRTTAEGAAHYPRSSARAAMLVQCTGAAPALHCTAMKPWPNLPSPAQETQKI